MTDTNIDGIEQTETTVIGGNAAASFGPGLAGVTKKFNFKARSIKNDKGEEIEKMPKQPSIEALIPVPTAETLIAILEQPDTLNETQADGSIVSRENAVKKLIQDAVFQVIFDQAKSHLDGAIESFGADKTKIIDATFIDYDKLSLDFIAAIPPSRRGAAAISEEEWTDFFKDYVNTMVQATAKDVAKLEKHVEIFKKPVKFRARKDLLGVLVEQLSIYATATASLDEFSAPYQRLLDQLTKYLVEEDRIDVDAL